MSKILVAYFSANGVTKNAAEKLAKAANADLFEIKPVRPYTDADLDWTDKKSRSTVEMNDLSSRPEIANKCENMGSYDVVFVGFPIWWYVEPRIIDTFLESYDFSEKTVIPFATSGGSGLGKTSENFKKILGANTTVKDGKLLTRASETDVSGWVKSRGIFLYIPLFIPKKCNSLTKRLADFRKSFSFMQTLSSINRAFSIGF